MKNCGLCGNDKHLTEFWKNKRSSDGLDRYCIPCGKQLRKEDYQKNKTSRLLSMKHYQQRPEYKEQHKLYQKNWLANGGTVWLKNYLIDYCKTNTEKRKAVTKEWYKCNPNRRSEILKVYRKNNPEKVSARVALQRAKRYRAVPKWFEKDKIIEVYKACKQQSLQDNQIYHIDHIVPINSDIVCGLHCYDNLQILIAEENLAKSNKLIELEGVN